MTPGARLSAAMDLIDQILGGQPAGITLTNWGRSSRFAGSKDRAAVRDIVFDCLRRARSLAHHAGGSSGRRLVIALEDLFGGQDALFTGQGYNPAPLTPCERAALGAGGTAPDPVAFDFPDFLEDDLKAGLGPLFVPVMQAMQSRAPVDLRVNRMKADPARAAMLLEAEDIATVPIEGIPNGLRITTNARRIGGSRAYRDGLVELQDASSQAVASMAGITPGMRVLDFCAGGGGKALALYDALGGKGQIVAHDIAATRMNDLPARAARAGARITLASPGHPALEPGSFDLVFVDAPCSGSGAWRRNPDAKWRLTPRDLARLHETQAIVLDEARRYLKPTGRMVYATCSVLESENEAQVAALLTRAPELIRKDAERFTPVDTGDGFFAASLVRG